MDILKKDSYKKTVLAVFLVLAATLNAIAPGKQPLQVLTDSYRLPDILTAEQAEKTISELDQALASCTDDSLKFRIEYRIGILYFKSDDFSSAIESFKKIARSEDGSDFVKICSLNMAGQIYRMQAKDNEALKAFEELIELSQERLTQDSNQKTASVLKLAITAGFARAEIHQYNQDYDSAIVEYQRIHACLDSCDSPDKNSYGPLALDRLSQIHLIKDRMKDYNQAAGKLVKKYPDYYRTGIIKLETEATELLKEKDDSINFTQGGFDAPGRLIALAKDSGDKVLKDKVVILLKNLSDQYRQSYSGILLGYHYAWILDTSGEPEQAIEVLKDVCKQATSVNSDVPEIASIIDTLADYAKFQQAIILGEENNYKEALETVCSVRPDPNNIHLFNLSNSTKKALETLKREVPKDVNDH